MIYLFIILILVYVFGTLWVFKNGSNGFYVLSGIGKFMLAVIIAYSLSLENLLGQQLFLILGTITGSVFGLSSGKVCANIFAEKNEILNTILPYALMYRRLGQIKFTFVPTWTWLVTLLAFFIGSAFIGSPQLADYKWVGVILFSFVASAAFFDSIVSLLATRKK